MCDIDKYIILVYVDESVRNIVMNSVAYSDTSVLCGALSQNFFLWWLYIEIVA